MGLIVRSTKAGATTQFATSFSLGNTLLVADLDTDLNSLYTLVNGNLDNNNLAPGTVVNNIEDGSITTIMIDDEAITNDKLGPDSVTTDKILDGTILVADTAPQSSVHDLIVAPGNFGGSVFAGAEGFWVPPSGTITVRGGWVNVFGNCMGLVIYSSQTAIIIRVRRDATTPTNGTIVSEVNITFDQTPVTGSAIGVAVPFPHILDLPAAGNHTYAVTVEVAVGAGGIFAVPAPDPGFMWVVEGA